MSKSRVGFSKNIAKKRFRELILAFGVLQGVTISKIPKLCETDDLMTFVCTYYVSKVKI